jgi:hypothetical protein
VHRLSTGFPHPRCLSTGLLVPCCPIFGSARFLLPLHRLAGCLLPLHRLTWFLLPLRRCNSILLPLHRLTHNLCCLRVRLALLPPGLLEKIQKHKKSIKPKKPKKNPFHWPFRFPNRVLKKNIWRMKKAKVRKKKLYGSLLQIAGLESLKTILSRSVYYS